MFHFAKEILQSFVNLSPRPDTLRNPLLFQKRTPSVFRAACGLLVGDGWRDIPHFYVDQEGREGGGPTPTPPSRPRKCFPGHQRVGLFIANHR